MTTQKRSHHLPWSGNYSIPKRELFNLLARIILIFLYKIIRCFFGLETTIKGNTFSLVWEQIFPLMLAIPPSYAKFSGLSLCNEIF